MRIGYNFRSRILRCVHPTKRLPGTKIPPKSDTKTEQNGHKISETVQKTKDESSDKNGDKPAKIPYAIPLIPLLPKNKFVLVSDLAQKLKVSPNNINGQKIQITDLDKFPIAQDNPWIKLLNTAALKQSFSSFYVKQEGYNETEDSSETSYQQENQKDPTIVIIRAPGQQGSYGLLSDSTDTGGTNGNQPLVVFRPSVPVKGSSLSDSASDNEKPSHTPPIFVIGNSFPISALTDKDKPPGVQEDTADDSEVAKPPLFVLNPAAQQTNKQADEANTNDTQHGQLDIPTNSAPIVILGPTIPLIPQPPPDYEDDAAENPNPGAPDFAPFFIIRPEVPITGLQPPVYDHAEQNSTTEEDVAATFSNSGPIILLGSPQTATGPYDGSPQNNPDEPEAPLIIIGPPNAGNGTQEDETPGASPPYLIFNPAHLLSRPSADHVNDSDADKMAYDDVPVDVLPEIVKNPASLILVSLSKPTFEPVPGNEEESEETPEVDSTEDIEDLYDLPHKKRA